MYSQQNKSNLTSKLNVINDITLTGVSDLDTIDGWFGGWGVCKARGDTCSDRGRAHALIELH